MGNLVRPCFSTSTPLFDSSTLGASPESTISRLKLPWILFPESQPLASTPACDSFLEVCAPPGRCARDPFSPTDPTDAVVALAMLLC